jgi:hypothetical protein
MLNYLKTIFLCSLIATGASAQNLVPLDYGPSPEATLQVLGSVINDNSSSLRHKQIAGNLAFEGEVRYSLNGITRNEVIGFDRLINLSYSNRSGNIRVILAATLNPIPQDESSFNYYGIGTAQGTPLNPREYYGKQDITVPYYTPPNGIYYLSLMILEQEPNCPYAENYCVDYSIQFPGRVIFSNGIPTQYNQEPTSAMAIEYFHAGFQHYFLTSIPNEIAALDSGVFKGWTRTGQSMRLWVQPGQGLEQMCRFFSTSFGEKSSHFYSVSNSECNTVRQNHTFSRNWQFEGTVAYIAPLDSFGDCPSNVGVRVYRLYNQGMGGAPNHRYTTDFNIARQMVNQFWIMEGNDQGFAGCVAGN